MVDFLSWGLQFFILLLVLINTIFSQKGFSNMNRWLDSIQTTIKELDVEPKESKKCLKCGKPIEEHTIAQAKKCGLLTEK